MPDEPPHDKRRDSNDTKLPEREGDAQSIIDVPYPAWADDAENNPRLWATRKKWTMVFLVAFYTFVSPLASSMMAPGLPKIADDLDIHSPTITALTLSIFLLAFALGPIVLAPLSEVYGRTWVLHFSNLFFLAFNLGCSLVTTSTGLIVCRFFAGLGGGAPVSIGGACMSDLFNERERAAAMAIYVMGPLLGPVIGPVAGGFVVQTIGYRWVFRIITLLSGVASLMAIPLLRETYAPVIIARLAEKRRRESGIDPEKALGTDIPVRKESVPQILWDNITRPVILLTRSLICFMLSAYMSLIYGLLYLLFTTFPTLFQDTYGWNTGVSGLPYIGIGIGFFFATAVGATFMNTLYLKLTDRNNGVGKPEYRLPSAILGGLLVPVGLLWYGWSAQAKLQFVMPIIGSGIFGAGMMFTFLPVQLYLVDSFEYAASALAAASVTRALFGFGFPLFAPQMFDALGLGGGYSLLAGLAILLGTPFPIWLYFRGEQMREGNKYTKRSASD